MDTANTRVYNVTIGGYYEYTCVYEVTFGEYYVYTGMY